MNDDNPHYSTTNKSRYKNAKEYFENRNKKRYLCRMYDIDVYSKLIHDNNNDKKKICSDNNDQKKSTNTTKE